MLRGFDGGVISMADKVVEFFVSRTGVLLEEEDLVHAKAGMTDRDHHTESVPPFESSFVFYVI